MGKRTESRSQVWGLNDFGALALPGGKEAARLIGGQTTWQTKRTLGLFLLDAFLELGQIGGVALVGPFGNLLPLVEG